MNLTNEITIISEVLQINESDLSKKLSVSLETLNNWKFGRKGIGLANLEKVYSFAYDNGIVLNNIYEQLLKEEYENNHNIVLFHGAKRPFSMPIDFVANSKARNDFGVGFYLGETFEQAANYISVINQNIVYCFRLNLSGLRTYKFNVNTEWMIAIAYFRGWLDDYKDCPLIKKLIGKVSDYDVIIAPIADNRMFDIIAEFRRNNDFIAIRLQCFTDEFFIRIRSVYFCRIKKSYARFHCLTDYAYRFVFRQVRRIALRKAHAAEAY